MREIHVIVTIPPNVMPERYEDIKVTHEPTDVFEGNDPNATRVTAREGDTELIVHWRPGIPQDKAVETHAIDAVLRSLGL